MALWRQSIRVLLVVCVVGVVAAVGFGIRDRVEPARALVVERTDPDAVIETRGSRIVQADAQGENLRVTADRQDTYRDGALRLVDNVEVTVADRDDRPGFVLTGSEAHLDAGKTEVRVSGQVQMLSSDGLSAATGEALYSDADGLVRMPSRTEFSQDGMEAAGNQAEYDRGEDVLRLLADARVDLVASERRTRIASRAATLTQTRGFMHFEDNVAIDTDTRQMTAREARVELGEGSRLETLELDGEARIVSAPEVDGGDGRQMAARRVTLGYSENGSTLEHAVLAGDAFLQTGNGASASQITSESMTLEFDPDDSVLQALVAQSEARLVLPAQPDRPQQTVTADSLTLTRREGSDLDYARFDGQVEYSEVSTNDDGEPTVRITRADRLDAVLSDGLAGLEEAQFLGNVTLEEPNATGRADEALYLIEDGSLSLITSGPAGRTPRFEDQRGSVQAVTIDVGVEDGHLVAEADVESVLLTEATGAAEGDETRRPGVLEASEPAYVTANRLDYDSDTDTALYTGDARLWQQDTEFRGQRLALDEAHGNLRLDGDVQTRSRIRQINDETGLPEESLTTGRAREFVFDDAAHQATYTTDAQVTGPRGDLHADIIRLFLLSDSETLERIEAEGEVELVMTGRQISGSSLVYYDAEGRYEMEGEPVRIVEEVDDECRETTGRTLTFYLTDDAVSVDGESQVRTETLRGACPELTP